MKIAYLSKSVAALAAMLTLFVVVVPAGAKDAAGADPCQLLSRVISYNRWKVANCIQIFGYCACLHF